jgi:hypothetical protein
MRGPVRYGSAPVICGILILPAALLPYHVPTIGRRNDDQDLGVLPDKVLPDDQASPDVVAYINSLRSD